MPQQWAGRPRLWQNRDAYGPGTAVIVPANSARQGLTIYNNTGVTMNVRAGPLATKTEFQLPMVSGSYYEWPPPVPTGDISVYVDSAIAVATINSTETELVLVNV
jgi:hypothetical protein